MRKDDVEYFRRRAVQERTMAVCASNADAAAAHNQLADRYEALASGQSLHLVSAHVPD